MFRLHRKGRRFESFNTHFSMRHIGKIYEQKALEFLERNGFEILLKNSTLGKSEVDIVCKKNEKIYAVEVKKRKSQDFLQIKNSQLDRIDFFMSQNFPGVFFEFFVIYFENNTVKILKKM